MLRSILGLVLALVTAAAPLASQVCQASCAARDTGASVSHHSCHEQVSEHGPTVESIHNCGHEDGVPTALERSVQVLLPPAIVPSVVVAFTTRQAVRTASASCDSSPPA